MRYKGLIDVGARTAHAIYMASTNVITVGESNQQIIGTIAGVACPPASTDQSSSTETTVNGSLREASINRLACLLRH